MAEKSPLKSVLTTLARKQKRIWKSLLKNWGTSLLLSLLIVCLLSKLTQLHLRSIYSFMQQYSANMFALINIKGNRQLCVLPPIFLLHFLSTSAVWWFYRLDRHEFSLTLCKRRYKIRVNFAFMHAFTLYRASQLFCFYKYELKGKKKNKIERKENNQTPSCRAII